MYIPREEHKLCRELTTNAIGTLAQGVQESKQQIADLVKETQAQSKTLVRIEGTLNTLHVKVCRRREGAPGEESTVELVADRLVVSWLRRFGGRILIGLTSALIAAAASWLAAGRTAPETAPPEALSVTVRAEIRQAVAEAFGHPESPPR
jgi:hypothetical protein